MDYETKAEELKNDLLNDNSYNLENEQVQATYDNILDHNQNLIDMFETMNSPEYQQMQSIISSDLFKNMMKQYNILYKYYNEIYLKKKK